MDAFYRLIAQNERNYPKKTDIARVNVDIFNLKKIS